MKNLKNKRGISLIVLVITIVLNCYAVVGIPEKYTKTEKTLEKSVKLL